MMKKLFLMLLLPACFLAANGQSGTTSSSKVPADQGFQKDKLFTGGTFNLGFGNRSTSLGISPQLGYSVTNWLDAGITVNVNYVSQRDNSVILDKLRQTTYGPGAFVRVFPINFLFATAVGEYNWIHQKYIPAQSGAPSIVNNISAPSLLVGGGYASGRQKGSNSYYYLSVTWDIAGDQNSPYIDAYNRSVPIIRAGYNIGLFQNRGRMNRRF